MSVQGTFVQVLAVDTRSSKTDVATALERPSNVLTSSGHGVAVVRGRDALVNILTTGAIENETSVAAARKAANRVYAKGIFAAVLAR